MTDTVTLGFDLEPSNSDLPLGIEVWINDTKFFDINALTESTHVEHVISDDDAAHQLKFVLKNKTPEHTKIDEAGNIISDSLVTIKNVKADDVEFGLAFTDTCQYRHSFNGNGPQVLEKFFGVMGCNGEVTFKFTTPVYIWFLEQI